MAIIWEHNFEDNSLAGYDSVTGTPTIQTSIVYEGTYALRCNPSASQHRLSDAFASTTQTIACSFWIRRAHATEDSPYLFFLTTSAGSDGFFVRYEGGVGLRLYWHDPQTLIATSSVAWTINVWTHIEVRANASANPWSVNWRVNGVEQTGGAAAHAAITFAKTDFGIFNYNMTHDAYFDKIRVSNDNAYIPGEVARPGYLQFPKAKLRPATPVRY